MSSKTVIGLVVVLAVLVVGGFFLVGRNDSKGSKNLEVTGAQQSSEQRTAITDKTPQGDAVQREVEKGGGTTGNGETMIDEGGEVVREGTIVSYTADGFTPKTITIKKGELITFVNGSGTKMWVASAQHPAHIVYSGTTLAAHCPDTSGTAFDQCESGMSFTFTFTKTGTWGYHNHLRASDWGSITVE